MNRMRRVAITGGVLAALATVFVAPAAHAQVGLPTTDSVTDVVGDTTDQVGDTVTGTVGTVGDVTDEAGETVNETVEDPGSIPDRVTDVVDDVTEDLPDGPVTGPVKDLVNDAGQAVDDATGGGSTDPVKGPGRGTFGNTPEERRDGRRSGSDRVLGNGTAGSTVPGSIPADGFVGALTLDVDEFSPEVRLEPAGPSFGERAAQIAVETAKRLAFPMLLLALVAMFLAFHGRVGRKDPKLALAAVDPEQNFLTFE